MWDSDKRVSLRERRHTVADPGDEALDEGPLVDFVTLVDQLAERTDVQAGEARARLAGVIPAIGPQHEDLDLLVLVPPDLRHADPGVDRQPLEDRLGVLDLDGQV